MGLMLKNSMQKKPMGSLRAAAGRVLTAFRSSGPLWTASQVLDRAGLRTHGLWPDKTVPVDALASQVAAVFRAWGMPEEHVAITTRHLLYADLHGIDSHGCGMLQHYHRGLASGLLTMTPKIEVIRESETTALFDGGGGLGHVPADTAMKLAIAKCRNAGLGAVAVRNSGHYGAAGSYAALAAESGCIGIATTNTAQPAVVPTFGLEAMLGTNPIAFAAPAARNRPFLLDMATSTVPLGKLMTAWRNGKTVPAGWALDDEGRPVTNPRLAFEHRRLTPLGSSHAMGSHKGYGLATMVEILSSLLPGLKNARSAAEPDGRVGHFFLAMDPRRFRGEGKFEADLGSMMDSLRACKAADPQQPVLVAGDPEYAAQVERRRAGIPLARSLFEDMRMVCRASGVPFVLDTKE
jgi:LDH2 family malate/lactate/ureidoglycolate dehydrogenase